MIGMDSNHCRVVADCLAGKRKADEETFDALAALGEKLEQLRRLDSIFSGVEFSAYAEELRSRKSPVAVG